MEWVALIGFLIAITMLVLSFCEYHAEPKDGEKTDQFYD